jgi:hypothetical protein
MSALARLVLAGVFVLVAADPAAAAPPNDNWGSPEDLGQTRSTIADNVTATEQPGEPLRSCAGTTMTSTVWYRIQGTGGTITLITTGIRNWSGPTAVYHVPAAPGIWPLVTCGAFRVRFESQAGLNYLVQVGSSECTLSDDACEATQWFRGQFGLEFVVPPSNDRRVAALPLANGVVATVPDTRGATIEPGETTTCAGDPPYGQTVWYRFDAQEPGWATFTASLSPARGGPAVAVYRESDGAALGCTPAAGQVATFRVPVSHGRYLVQVGDRGEGGRLDLVAHFERNLDVDGDGSERPADCNDGDPRIRPGLPDGPENGIDENCDGLDAVNLDRDADGYQRPHDCDDANAAVNPGARDVPGNRADEDCDGAPLPHPRLETSFAARWAFGPFRFTKLHVARAPVGARIVVRCSGRGCKDRKDTTRVKRYKRKVSVLGSLRHARLRRGAKVKIKVTLAGHEGVMRTYKVRRAGKDPKAVNRCLTASRGRAFRC